MCAATFQSGVNPEYHYSEDQYVISLMNMGAKTGGHAAIVVEGVQSAEDAPLYEGARSGERLIAHYDILAGSITETVHDVVQDSLANTQGVITAIRTFEGDACREIDYTEFSSKQWYATPEDVQRMVAGIHEKQIQLENGKAEGLWVFRYQKAGAHRLGGNGGHNCVTWCEEQLIQARIGHGKKFGDKIAAMPEKHTWNCAIL